MDQPVTIAAVPAPLRWLRRPEAWDYRGGALSIASGPHCDLFTDPGTGAATADAPALVAELDGDFWLSARVTADLAAVYDAGVLVAYAHEGSWAKLCLERSPQGRPTIVSVVTRQTSDDCNSFGVGGGRAWLRLARMGSAFAFHASADAAFWHLVRYFAHEDAGRMAIGFLAQSPTGRGCTATFDDIRFSPTRLAGLRDGT